MSSSLPPDNRTLTNAMFRFQQEPGAETARPLYEALVGATLVLIENEDAPEVLTDIASSARQRHFRLPKGSGGGGAVPPFPDPQAVRLRDPTGGCLGFVPPV